MGDALSVPFIVSWSDGFIQNENRSIFTLRRIICLTRIIQRIARLWGARDDAMVRALVSHQCGPGSNPGVDAICGLSLLLVLSFFPTGFSPGTPVFPSPQKFHFDQESGRRRTAFVDVLPPNHSLFIYLFRRIPSVSSVKTANIFPSLLFRYFNQVASENGTCPVYCLHRLTTLETDVLKII